MIWIGMLQLYSMANVIATKITRAFLHCHQLKGTYKYAEKQRWSRKHVFRMTHALEEFLAHA